MIRYTRDEINNIRKKNISITVPENVLVIVEQIVREVGCPSYIKTPNFTNKRLKRKIVERPNKPPYNPLNEIQSICNKFSDKNFEKLKIELLDVINSSKSSDIVSFKDVINKIYECCTTGNNIVLYARLFDELNNLYPEFKQLFLEEYKNYFDHFKKIKCINPEEDYDEFCRLNAINARTRNISKLYTELVFYNILNIKDIMDLILLLQQQLIDKGKLNTPSENPCMEYAENLFILTSGCLQDLVKQQEDWNKIYDNILFIKNIDKNVNKNITSKVKFKHMDILDCIKKM